MERLTLWFCIAGLGSLTVACADQKAAPASTPGAETSAADSPASGAAGASGAKAEGKAQPSPASPSPPAPSKAAGSPSAAPGLTPLTANPSDHSGALRWSHSLGSPGTDAARDVAIGPSGDVAVVGYHASGVVTATGAPIPAQALDAFASWYTDSGELRHQLHFGGVGEDVANAVAFTPSGHLVLAGLFSDEMSVGDIRLRATGSDDIFVAQFDPKGDTEWAFSLGGLDSDGANDVAVAADGAIYITGSFKDTMKVADDPLESAGNEDIFVLKLTPQGHLAWIQRFGHRGRDFGQRLAIDGAGHIVLLAEFTDEVTIGGDTLTSEGNRDLAVAKLTSAGEIVWSRRFGSPFNEFGLGLAVDPAGNIALTGSFDNQIDFGGGKLTSAGESDIFVAKLDADGAHLWSKRFGGAREDIGYGVAADRYGNLAVTGWFWNTLDVGGTELRAEGVNKDIFLLKLSAAGDSLWAHRFGGPDHDQGRGVAMGADGDVAITGIFRFGLDLGEQQLESVREADDKAPPPDIFTAVFSR
ncbi:MAG: hypothetical protein Tsb0020_01960 [Haliangiales bacterium]